MACKALYELHHHFPKLAEESGFTFNTHRPRIRIDWNKIKLIDVDNLIRERKFNLIEQHVNDILDCVLESEFDVRILDEGVLKMFRLAQLAVEYQQFCRHYLDRSVYVLREEVSSLAQELNATKRELREKDDELKRFKRKSKSPYKPQLPYGNENIATMILKTLANKGDMFPSTPTTDALHYNKCTYCEKVFLNQLYLKSHISRRHSHTIEVPEKEFAENITECRNTQFNEEINLLKTKLKEMEDLFKSKMVANNVVAEERVNKAPSKEIGDSIIEMKDAEVSAVSDGYILNKIEEWKKEEHEKYNKEINLLRNQIIETMNNLKIKDEQKTEIIQNSDHTFVQKLHARIKQQGEELVELKQELINSKSILQSKEASKRKEKELQIAFWEKRAEEQAKQYESLLDKLNAVAKEAHDSKTLAEAERQRAVQLEELLQKALINNSIRTSDSNKNQSHSTYVEGNNNDTKNKADTKLPFDSLQSKSKNKSSKITDRTTLEKLHQKAQELLNVSIISSSDISTASTDNIKQIKHPTNHKKSDNSFVRDSHTNRAAKKKYKSKGAENKSKVLHSSHANTVIAHEVNRTYVPNNDELKLNKDKSRSHSQIKLNGSFAPGSPNKLVRAKLTEEVNNRLVSFGVDPLKSRLHKNLFKSKRMQLQKLQELKAKKNPGHERVKHSILAYLDSTTADNSKEKVNASSSDSISPNKLAKTFSITSVISNVKNKALALVKSHDMKSKTERNLLQSEVTKRAQTLLRTPPHSATSSPENKPETISTKKQMTNIDEQRIRTNRSTNPEEKPATVIKMKKIENVTSSESESDSSGLEDNNGDYVETNMNQKTVKSIENLIKSPARRPSSASGLSTNGHSEIMGNGKLAARAQSASNILKFIHEVPNLNNPIETIDDNISAESETSEAIKRSVSEHNALNLVSKQTKGVLKSASSISSLNKKKVLFDMDAIQMKSVSASPSQSTTEKSDKVEKYELGLINLENEEWDISSIENEPLKNDTKIQINTRTSPKIAELKQTIESQLARRNETPSAVLVGGIDVISGGMARGTSLGGSNTSLGSSILDESEHIPVNHRTVVKPKKFTEKDDSDLDLSEFSIDGLIPKSKHDGF